MIPVEVKEPKEESYIIVKRYLCPKCIGSLKRLRFIMDAKPNSKINKKEDKNGKKQTEEGRSTNE